MSGTIQVVITDHKNDECTMCTRARKEKYTGNMYRVTSTHEQRNLVVVYCGYCAVELLDQLQLFQNPLFVEIFNGVKHIAEDGLRCDLTPTHDMSSLEKSEAFWHNYIKRADDMIRERARTILWRFKG